TYVGWGKRPYNWEFTLGGQQEVMPRVSVDVAYIRRVYGNLLVTNNVALKPSDYDPFSVTAPVDPLPPRGGGYVIPNQYDLNPIKTVGGVPTQNLVTFADNYGNTIAHWNGVDINVNARAWRGLTVAGGVSTGRTSTDNCALVSVLPQIFSD